MAQCWCTWKWMDITANSFQSVWFLSIHRALVDPTWFKDIRYNRDLAWVTFCVVLYALIHSLMLTELFNFFTGVNARAELEERQVNIWSKWCTIESKKGPPLLLKLAGIRGNNFSCKICDNPGISLISLLIILCFAMILQHSCTVKHH